MVYDSVALSLFWGFMKLFLVLLFVSLASPLLANGDAQAIPIVQVKSYDVSSLSFVAVERMLCTDEVEVRSDGEVVGYYKMHGAMKCYEYHVKLAEQLTEQFGNMTDKKVAFLYDGARVDRKNIIKQFVLIE